MLLSNSRIVKNERIEFYEQDILLDDYIYSGNIQVTIDVDYKTPGIGIALVSSESLSLEEDAKSYLFRIGHSEYSINRTYGAKNEIIENGAVVNIKPFKKNMIIQLRKINNRVSFFVNGKQIAKKFLTEDFKTYCLGFYGNAGNIINSISIASEIPEGWVVNMSNTGGGYIKFSKNKFKITNCSDLAEIEQVKVNLKANDEKHTHYYLKYDKELVSGKNDIKAYVFYSNDTRYVDEQKNILEGDKFVLKKDQEINIKFVGTEGIISNVQITNSEDDFYVGTDYNAVEIKSSLLKLKTKELSKIEWSGTIFNTPEYFPDEEDREEFAVIQDNNKMHTPKECKVKLNETYKYEVVFKQDSAKAVLIIYNKDRIVSTTDLAINNSVTIFNNMNATIENLILYKTDGRKVNILLQNTKKQYVSAAIKSPIVVVNEEEMPLDLSSSYRVSKNDNNETYIFTNVEREVFGPSNKIKLENIPLLKQDTIIVRGVLKDSKVYSKNIMSVNGTNVNDINMYCDSYETLREKDLFHIDKENKVITISDEQEFVNKYKQLVVDYLKHDSYCINYNHQLSAYEIDISTNKNTKVCYDGVKDDSESLVNINEYKILNDTIKNNSYIVLKSR